MLSNRMCEILRVSAYVQYIPFLMSYYGISIILKDRKLRLSRTSLTFFREIFWLKQVFDMLLFPFRVIANEMKILLFPLLPIATSFSFVIHQCCTVMGDNEVHEYWNTRDPLYAFNVLTNVVTARYSVRHF